MTWNLVLLTCAQFRFSGLFRSLLILLFHFERIFHVFLFRISLFCFVRIHRCRHFLWRCVEKNVYSTSQDKLFFCFSHLHQTAHFQMNRHMFCFFFIYVICDRVSAWMQCLHTILSLVRRCSSKRTNGMNERNERTTTDEMTLEKSELKETKLHRKNTSRRH